MAYMSSFQMKNPPPDGEILDDWEQMADSGVSSLILSYLTQFCHNFVFVLQLLDKKLQNLKTRIPNEEVR